MKTVQKKYVPSLQSLQSICSRNYSRLMKLIPDCDEENLHFHIELSDRLQYRIALLSSARYTTELKIEQLGTSSAYLKPVMVVRLYHDARMAEVVSSQHASAIAPSYKYPNPNMFHPDEKERVNEFLAEWLAMCLHQNTIKL